MNKFTHKIEFGFGIELDSGKKPITTGERVKMLSRLGKIANLRFGGYTLTDTFGSWINNKGITFSERGKTLTIYTDQAGAARAVQFANLLKKILRQEAVAICITEVNALLV